MPGKPPSRKIKALLFDLGKVIVNFDFTPAFRRLARHCPFKPGEIKDYFATSGLEVLYDGGQISSLEFYRAVKKDLSHGLDFDRFRKIWNEIFRLNKDVADIIHRAAARYRLVLISNTNAMHFSYVRTQYPPVRRFDRFILSYKEKVRKPDPKIYQTAIRACRAHPGEIFYVDDREDLTLAARSLGLETFTYRQDTRALLKKMGQLDIRW